MARTVHHPRPTPGSHRTARRTGLRRASCRLDRGYVPPPVGGRTHSEAKISGGRLVMSKRRRRHPFWAGGVAACTLAVLPGAANAARTMSVRDEGSLAFKGSSGSQLVDEGHAKGTLPGWVKVRLTYNGNPTVYARFTIYTNGGSINGRATGRVGNPSSANPSFRGSLTVTGGSGR